MNTFVLQCMFCAALLAFVGARPAASLAQDEAIDLFKREMAEMQSTMKKMAERIEQLEAERERTNGKIARVEQSIETVQSAPSALNPAMGWPLMQRRSIA